MTTLEFQDLFFTDGEVGEDGRERVKVLFLKNFYFYLDKNELDSIGRGVCVPKGHEILFEGISIKQAYRKLGVMLAVGFGELKSALTDHDAVYIHKNSGIPLFGTLYFGIVDRGTNMIEVKPITGCNIDCVFCSVFEGKNSKKMVDYVVENEYMVEQVDYLLKRKDLSADQKIDVYINTHGEPLLHGDIVGLVEGLKSLDYVGQVIIITNGLLLTKELIDKLVEAGLDALNVSMNSIDQQKAKELAGSNIYDVDRVKKMLENAAGKLKLVIAPVYIKGVNDKEMDGLIKFAKSIGAEIGIQNYMLHKRGKKVADELGWDKFISVLEELEKKHGVVLKMPKHKVFATKQLDMPFKKDDIVRAEIVCKGRRTGEVLAKAKDRIISVLGCDKFSGSVKVKITKVKDGLFGGQKV